MLTKKDEKPFNLKEIVRRLSFYFFLYCLIPACFFVLMEIALRVLDYGYPSSFFVKDKIGDKEYYVNNYKFSWRFFPKSMARLSASVVVPVEKDKDAFRVFVFGESAAMGDPDPAFSFSRMLQAMLEKKYPDKKIEIYNTAVTAINSHVLLPIVNDCLALAPDLFIVYAGNNEVIGPYGLSAALSPFLSNRAIIKSKIWFDQTKTGQWLANLTVDQEIDQREWKGMEMFMKNSVRFDDPKLETVYANFQSNLSEICSKTTAAGVKVILSTVITNVSDCAPFLSVHHPSKDKPSLKQWQDHYNKGVMLADSGYFEKAIERYLEAYAIDNEHAELNFRLGKCYFRTGQIEKANALFAKAQDLDALRFRTDSHLNEIIKRVAYEYSDKGVALADAKTFSDQQSKSGLTGNDLMYEHVHLNLKGNFVLANCILQQVENALGLPHSMEVVDLKSCISRLAYSSFDEKRIAEINLSRIQSPPFTNQYTNRFEIAETEKSLDNIRQDMDSSNLSKADVSYKLATENFPLDWFLHLNYLRFLHYHNYYQEAADEADILFGLLPHEYLSRINLGITRKSLKKYSESEEHFQQAIHLNPYFSEAYKNMALLYEEQGSYYKAVYYLQKSNLPIEGLAIFYNRVGIQFAKENNADSAIAYFTKAVDLNTNLIEARQNLKRALSIKEKMMVAPSVSKFSDEYNRANLLFREGKYQEAIEYYQKSLRITPSFPNAHNNMGICFIQLALYEEARHHFSEAIKIDPDFYDAYPNLAMLLNQQGQYAEAIKVLDRAMILKEDPELYHIMAEAYFQLGDGVSATKYREHEKRIRKQGS